MKIKIEFELTDENLKMLSDINNVVRLPNDASVDVVLDWNVRCINLMQFGLIREIEEFKYYALTDIGHITLRQAIN